MNNEMIINRHNYEEYFILYMDNELNSEERCMVEAFLRLHPDLKEEFYILQQFKLEPDSSIGFLHKEDLMKENGEALITVNNYEEWLMLYIDNELDQKQRLKVEYFIAGHPSIAADLTLLQKTKLQPENIVFANKEALYRHTEKVQPIAFKWWRVAAAILILGVGITTALLLNNKKTDSATATKNIPADPKNDKPELVKETVPVPTNAVSPQQNASIKKKSSSPGINTTNDGTNPVYKQALVNNVIPPVQKDSKKEIKKISPIQDDSKQVPVIANNNNTIKQNNNLPKPDQNPFVTNKEDNVKALVNNNTPVSISNDNNSATNKDVTTGPAQPSDYVLASNDGKKNKNRGIFRKIARTFEKRTNIDPTDDGDRLLVAGFAINMK